MSSNLRRRETGAEVEGEDMDFAMPERELFQEFYCYGFVMPHVPA